MEAFIILTLLIIGGLWFGFRLSKRENRIEESGNKEKLAISLPLRTEAESLTGVDIKVVEPTNVETTNKLKSESSTSQSIHSESKDAKAKERVKELSILRCPEVCEGCVKFNRKLKLEGGSLKLADMGLSMFGFPIKLAGEQLFAVLQERKIKIANVSKNLLIGETPVKFVQIIPPAYQFEKNASSGYVLFLFKPKSFYNYGTLFHLTPTSAEKLAEYFYIFPILTVLSKSKLVGICQEKKGKPSLIANFLYNGITGTFRILPGKRKYPVIIESVGNAPGNLLPKPLHLSYAELFTMENSNSLKTRSFGKAFELVYLNGEVSKLAVKKLLSFFIAEPKIPEFHYILKLVRKHKILSLKELLPFLEQIIDQKRDVKDIAFTYRLLAEYAYENGKKQEALKLAQKALSLDESVGVKRLISKLKNQ